MSVREVPARQGTPWSPEEDEALRLAFAEKAPIPDLAGRHQRTTGAIRSRLVKLGLITSDGEPIDQAPPPPSPTPDATSDELVRLPLSPRLAAAMVELKVRTIDGFAALTPHQLLQVPRMRQRTLRELAWLQAGLRKTGAVHRPTDELQDLLDASNASMRLRRAIVACAVTTVDELRGLEARRLLRVPSVGRHTVAEFNAILRELGPHPASADDGTAPPPQSEATKPPRSVGVDQPVDATPPPPQSAAVLRLDQLVRDLKALRGVLVDEEDNAAKAHREVMKSFARFDDAVLQLTIAGLAEEKDASEGDPLPDRLRHGLADLLTACVPDQKNRYVALRVLGLDGDGQPLRLSDLAGMLGVSRERVRQRRVKALSEVHAAARRRIASCQRLRAVMQAISPTTDWTDPQQSARHVVQLLSDKVPVVEELTLMCCLAAGWDGAVKDLATRMPEVAAEACSRAAAEIPWRWDIWKDATTRALFPYPATEFDGFPADLGGRKREPGMTRDEKMLFFRSAKLGREVACESGMEYKVMAWMEKTPEVTWFQEQPVVVPYRLHGRDRRYYPDVATLDRDGRCYVIEVKPVHGMYRERTLAKALACLDYVGERGMGYLLVDHRGYTVADYASAPFDAAIADEIDTLIDELGRIRFAMVRAVFEDKLGKMPPGQFISMVLNRDWAVTEAPGVTVGRLADGLSFEPLLSYLPRW